MSSKGKPKKSQNVTVVVHRPTGPAPVAQVTARHMDGTMVRDSKGFSVGEVEAAGVELKAARKWGLPLDFRRRSVYDANVESLKGWHSKSRREEVVREAKKLEEEVEKVVKVAEKEIKKGASKVKAEARKTKKEAEKLEKEVVEKVEQPVKSRRAKKAKKASEEDKQ